VNVISWAFVKRRDLRAYAVINVKGFWKWAENLKKVNFLGNNKKRWIVPWI